MAARKKKATWGGKSSRALAAFGGGTANGHISDDEDERDDDCGDYDAGTSMCTLLKTSLKSITEIMLTSKLRKMNSLRSSKDMALSTMKVFGDLYLLEHSVGTHLLQGSLCGKQLLTAFCNLAVFTAEDVQNSVDELILDVQQTEKLRGNNDDKGGASPSRKRKKSGVGHSTKAHFARLEALNGKLVLAQGQLDATLIVLHSKHKAVGFQKGLLRSTARDFRLTLGEEGENRVPNNQCQ